MKILFRIHALERMFERGIAVGEVRMALEKGETIETYPEGASNAGRLILTRHGRRALHVVAAENTTNDEAVIITSYRPNPSRWTGDFKRRRDEVPGV